LRSHGSLSLNRALMAAGLVDRVQVTLFPVITGQTGLDPIFHGAADFDLELIEHRTLDGHTQELTYRPTRTEIGPRNAARLLYRHHQTVNRRLLARWPHQSAGFRTTIDSTPLIG